MPTVKVSARGLEEKARRARNSGLRGSESMTKIQSVPVLKETTALKDDHISSVTLLDQVRHSSDVSLTYEQNKPSLFQSSLD